MDGLGDGLGRARAHEVPAAPVDPVSASTNATGAVAAAEIASALGGGEFAAILVFAATSTEFDALAAGLSDAYPETLCIGCTTAGEIGPLGYQSDSVVAVGLPSANFAVRSRLIAPLSRFKLDDGAGVAAELLSPSGLGEAALWPGAFALLLIDGLSRREDSVVSSIGAALGGVPLVGGSAGDGLDFSKSRVLHGGQWHEDAAVLVLVRTRLPFEAFCTDHFVPTARRMVVTAADPDARVVSEINAEPAAAEYARLIGLDPGSLSPAVFASRPVLVQVGGRHYVRAIQKVEKTGDLRFYSAIDEGLVLTIAEGRPMAAHLEATLGSFETRDTPCLTLAFDCVLRRLEAEAGQATRAISESLARRNVVGFSTYGEQYGSMHLNQTLTGIVLYPVPAHGA